MSINQVAVHNLNPGLLCFYKSNIVEYNAE